MIQQLTYINCNVVNHIIVATCYSLCVIFLILQVFPNLKSKGDAGWFSPPYETSFTRQETNRAVSIPVWSASRQLFARAITARHRINAQERMHVPRITQMQRAGHLAGGGPRCIHEAHHLARSRTHACTLMQRRQFSRLHAAHVQPSAFIFGHLLPRISIVDLRLRSTPFPYNARPCAFSFSTIGYFVFPEIRRPIPSRDTVELYRAQNLKRLENGETIGWEIGIPDGWFSSPFWRLILFLSRVNVCTEVMIAREWCARLWI